MLTPQATRLVLAAPQFGSLLAALAATYNIGRANASTSPQQVEKQERVLEDLIPKHVPLSAKIRKEKEKGFKDLNNDKWARDFELEVTNMGDKPIYYFYLVLVTDTKMASGSRILFPITYGRTELGDHKVKATPDDVPLKPGESVFLTFHPGNLAGWEKGQRDQRRPDPKKLHVMLETLSFGDGTGFMGEDGVAVPRKPGSQPYLTGCEPQQNKGSPKYIAFPLLWEAANCLVD